MSRNHTSAVESPPGRAPLSPARVLTAAMKLADEGGIEALSMRKLGLELTSSVRRRAGDQRGGLAPPDPPVGRPPSSFGPG